MENPSEVQPTPSGRRALRIFRARDARNIDSEMMPVTGMTPAVAEGLGRTVQAGVPEGTVIREVFSDTEADSRMSILYVWLKSNFQLPIHSHDADCAYYVISGQAHLGTEVLEAGDCFFVPAGTRYSYRVGDAGAEVLEVRTANKFSIDFTGCGPRMFERIADVATRELEHWRNQEPPAAVKRFGSGSEWLTHQTQ